MCNPNRVEKRRWLEKWGMGRKVMANTHTCIDYFPQSICRSSNDSFLSFSRHFPLHFRLQHGQDVGRKGKRENILSLLVPGVHKAGVERGRSVRHIESLQGLEKTRPGRAPIRGPAEGREKSKGRRVKGWKGCRSVM